MNTSTELTEDESSVSSKKQMYNFLTHDSSDDDQDIICLNTIFKPARKTREISNLNVVPLKQSCQTENLSMDISQQEQIKGQNQKQNLSMQQSPQPNSIKSQQKFSILQGQLQQQKVLKTKQHVQQLQYQQQYILKPQQQHGAQPQNQHPHQSQLHQNQQRFTQYVIMPQQQPYKLKVQQLQHQNHFPSQQQPEVPSKQLSLEQTAQNCFSDDEETIDDVIKAPSVSTLQTNSPNQTVNVSTSESTEPPLKKKKVKVVSPKFRIKPRDPSSSPAKNNNKQLGINSFEKPDICFLDLIVIILKNSKCLLDTEVWDYISGLFPFYERYYKIEEGVKKVKSATRKSSLFLKTSSVLRSKSNKKLIMLNPAMQLQISNVSELIKKKKKSFLKSLYNPDIFNSLVDGNLDLQTIKLIHNRRGIPFTNFPAEVRLRDEPSPRSRPVNSGTGSPVCESGSYENISSNPPPREVDSTSEQPLVNAESSSSVYQPGSHKSILSSGGVKNTTMATPDRSGNENSLVNVLSSSPIYQPGSYKNTTLIGDSKNNTTATTPITRDRSGSDHSHSSSDILKNLTDVNVLDLVDGGEKSDVLSPKSNSSADSSETVVFDPKIVSCCSLNGKEDEYKDDTINIDCDSNGDDVGLKSTLSSYTTNVFGRLENERMSSQIVSVGSFANTVWSQEDQSSKSKNNLDKRKSTSSLNYKNTKEEVASFPEVEKCIPRWREIFPWMSWKPWLKKVFCESCQSLFTKANSGERAIIVEILHPDDLFKVSKLLRAHAEKNSHKMAVILENKSIISILSFMLSSHFNEFSSVEEIINVFKDLVSDGIIVTQDLLNCAVLMLGQFLEEKVIAQLKKGKKFSVITDPCSGLLIVRWVNSNDKIEEHVLSSYLIVQDKTPVDYLAFLGLHIKSQMLFYITNSRCEDCVRCRTTKKTNYRVGIPLRLPQLDRYLTFLWRTRLLKPFYSIGAALCKLWLNYPHKFSEAGKLVSLEKLAKFPSSPDIFADVFKHFDTFRNIASSIHSVTGNLEALGFMTVDTARYSWLTDMFPILKNINILLMEIRIIYPFHRDFDHLFHNVENLNIICEKYKSVLRNKKVKIPGFKDSDFDEVYNLVNLTVKEYQQQIYHKGKSVAMAFNRTVVHKNLEQYISNSNVQSTFTALFSAIKSNFKYENTDLLKYLTKFLSNHKNCEKKNSLEVLEYFQKNKPLIKEEPVVYSFYRLIASLPFQPADSEIYLYEIKVYNQLFYHSPWSGIGPDVKGHLLTIISELNGKTLLSEKEIIQWWVDKTKSP